MLKLLYLWSSWEAIGEKKMCVEKFFFPCAFTVCKTGKKNLFGSTGK